MGALTHGALERGELIVGSIFLCVPALSCVVVFSAEAADHLQLAVAGDVAYLLTVITLQVVADVLNSW